MLRSAPAHALLFLFALSIFVFATPACRCGVPPATGGDCVEDKDCSPAEQCVDRTCVARPEDGGQTGSDGGSTSCAVDSECPGGACLDGACCQAALICGSACCGGAEVCFASACITPGAPCLFQTDCAANQICEPSLGSGADGGTPPDAGGALCVGAAIVPGRCIDLPPPCSAPGAQPESCIRDVCEYRPAPDVLDAVVQWQWGQGGAGEFIDAVDVWSTPVVGRLHDTNCDGRIDELDPPAIVFVSANVQNVNCNNGQRCKDGVLRALDGRTGQELWSLVRPEAGSRGFAGFTLAIGDVTGDGRMEIVAASGEGHVFLIDGDGTVLRKSDLPIAGSDQANFGWGGAFALGDMDGDGFPEIAYADQVFTTTDGALKRLFVGGQGVGGAGSNGWRAISVLVDLTGDGKLELLAGRTAYRADGSVLWNQTGVQDGYSAVADFDGDGLPEAVLVANGRIWILEGATGEPELGPLLMPGSGSGGPPTVADFTGDGRREVGVAKADFYSVVVPDYALGEIRVLWSAPAHDFSSSVTGSTVFDFEGDGVSEVVYADECFLWVYDGPTGAVKFVGLTTSFTATEASLVADIDGDGKAEMLLVHNGVSVTNWHCAHHTTGTDGWPAWSPPQGSPHYRGITALRDRANAWVGTRALWNQHAYQVTNVCSDRDTACDPPRPYGAIPEQARRNWQVSWLNNFRQNVQESGLFDAPDAVVSLTAGCDPTLRLVAAVRNRGTAILPAGVTVGFFARDGGADVLLGSLTTGVALYPGQATELAFPVLDPPPAGDGFVAKILVDPAAPTFRECDEGNNDSAPAFPVCIG